MTLPPALSWMHLFGREASYEFDASAPPWMRALVGSAKPRSGGMNVQVSGNGFLAGDAFVGINSRIRNDRLQSEGYAYIRRFAVLPDLKTARWFVPLDSPALSCAGFSLYSPARLSARLKVAAARIAAYSKLPIWYRDHIVIAQRTVPPIEQKMSEIFNGAFFRLALSSGAPEPARNRKVSLAIIQLDGRIIGFGKAAHSPLSNRLMRDEARALSELATRRIGAPQLLFAGEVDGAFVTVQKPLIGKPVSSKLTDNKRTLLEALRSDRLQPASECNMVTALPARLAQLQYSASLLSDALGDVLPILARTRVPSTIVHGDFAPWNLREHNGAVAAFDWEYAELDGLPYADETHYLLQVGYLLENWDLDHACAALGQMRLKNDLSLLSEQMRAIQATYLIDNLARLFAEGYDREENDMVGWYCKLLARLTRARTEALGV
jgi:hypothetical protein